jgi:DNA-binding NarL/FixJ family response regulator
MHKFSIIIKMHYAQLDRLIITRFIKHHIQVITIRKGTLPMQPIQVLIVTTNDLVRSGIQMLIGQTSHPIEIAGTFPTLHLCKQHLSQARADIMLLDDALPIKSSTIQTITDLRERYPFLRIVVIGGYLSQHYVQRLIDHGASGFIFKEDRLEESLVGGLQGVTEGYLYLSPEASALPYGPTAPGSGLNRTDLEVLQLIARGYTVPEIAARVGIVDRTVYRIRARLRHHLGVRTNEQVVDAAVRRGLLGTVHTAQESSG